MAYTLNIPAATDIPAQSQPLMQDNCNQIATALAVDHGAFNAATEGQHDKISFTGTGAVPATNFGLYATAAAMLLRNNGTNIDITSKTFTHPTYTAGGVNSTSNYFFLPCGLIVKYGTRQTLGTGSLAAPINLDGIGPVIFNAIPFVLVAATRMPISSLGVGAEIFACVRNLTSAALDVATRGSNGLAIAGSIQWLAIGTY